MDLTMTCISMATKEVISQWMSYVVQGKVWMLGYDHCEGGGFRNWIRCQATHLYLSVCSLNPVEVVSQ